MVDITEDFKSQLSEGDIHVRDNLQFELKSEFSVSPQLKKNIYVQDIFVFIPRTLQINKDTYSKVQFYLDETSFIRYKTPLLPLKDLTEKNNLKSPLIMIKRHLEDFKRSKKKEILDELKLFGSMFRSALRDQIHDLLNDFKKSKKNSLAPWSKQIENLCHEIKNIKLFYSEILSQFHHIIQDDPVLKEFFVYIDEFINDIIEYYLTNFLKMIRDSNFDDIQNSDRQLCKLIIESQEAQDKYRKNLEKNGHFEETILYRERLLNQFVLEALTLNSSRISIEEKHGNIMGSIAAGIAMLVYLILFAWNSTLAINSVPFILMGVFIYILKDRLKEGLKRLYYKEAFRWFPDYATEIKDRRGKIIGKLLENFSFITEKQLPVNFLALRNEDSKDAFPALKRSENIIHYKREIILFSQKGTKRRRELTTIFRLNLHQFLEKASNAVQSVLTLDKDTYQIHVRLLPKVYHLNVIIRNSLKKTSEESQSEIKKFRIIIDKFGIKRVEDVR